MSNTLTISWHGSKVRSDASGQTLASSYFLVQVLTGITSIRAIGGLANKFPNYETLHKANVAYPIAAAQKFAEALAPKMERGHRFRFVFTSGAMAEQPP